MKLFWDICHKPTKDNIQLLGGRGLECLNWTNDLFHLLSAIFYLFQTLPQAKYLFHFLIKKNSVYNVVSQPRLSIDVGVKDIF